MHTDDKGKVGIVYTIEHLDKYGNVKSVETIHNIMPDDAITYLLNAGFKGGSQYSDFYLGLYTNGYTAIADDDMASFISACGESSGYGSSDRETITFPEVADNSLTTSADPNVMTFASGATIRGGFVTTGSTIGGTTGLLVSAALFTSPKVLEEGESLRCPLGIALITA